MKTLKLRPTLSLLLAIFCVSVFVEAAEDGVRKNNELRNKRDKNEVGGAEVGSVFVHARTRGGLDLIGTLVSFEDGVFAVKKMNSEIARVKVGELAKISFRLRRKPETASSKYLSFDMAAKIKKMREAGTLMSNYKRLNSQLKKSKNAKEALGLAARITIVKAMTGKKRTRRDIGPLVDEILDGIEHGTTRDRASEHSHELVREIMTFMREAKLGGGGRGAGGGGRGSRPKPNERPDRDFYPE